MIKIYRYRVKSMTGELNRQARAVNYVWNFCNDTQKHALKWDKKWPTWIDLGKLTSGSSKTLGLHADTIAATCAKYCQSRKQSKRAYLRYRGKRSLGWIPLKGPNLRRDGLGFKFTGKTFKVFVSRPLPEGKIKDGSNFSQDAKGNWFLNIAIEVAEAAPRNPVKVVGIDLGLKDFATLSTGEKIEAQRIYVDAQQALAVAQRARKKRRVNAIHIRIANRRKDFHHKLSSRIVKEFDYVAVGNVDAARLAKTSMAKSVNDAGWSSFRDMLKYKSIATGAMFHEVDERFTSQVCSNCGCLPDSRPKGIADLGIREWVCSDCGAMHDRDTNAALNILRRGLSTLEVGVTT